MISVVIPTMWKYKPFLDFVSYYIKLDVVGEVIIINNDVLATPNHPVLTHPKMRVLTFGENIFVNRAWNFGVKEAKHDVVAILNDDLIFDLKVFYRVDEFIQPDMGAFGLCTGKVQLGQIPITNGTIDIVPYGGRENTWGFGELMFVHKKHWIDIPQGLDIGFGDVWIFERYCFNGFQNYFICNLFHYHENSTTQNSTPHPIRAEILAREREIYKKWKHDFILNPEFAYLLRKQD